MNILLSHSCIRVTHKGKNVYQTDRKILIVLKKIHFWHNSEFFNMAPYEDIGMITLFHTIFQPQSTMKYSDKVR